MRALDRKLLRDLGRLWPQLLAIAAVIAAGVAVCITMLSALESLRVSRDDYYARTRFADVFASVTRAPESVAQRLREIPGVETVETRIAAEVTLDVPGLAEPAVGRLISIPDDSEPMLNRLLIRRGAYPAPSRGDQVLASEAFVNAHGLPIGSSLAAVVNGRWRRIFISGVALSPEYVYSIRASDLFPDDKRFGAFWMRRRDLAAAFDLDGAFNDVAIRVARGTVVPEVIARVDRVLAPYGGRGAYEQKDQTSAWFLENEFSQLSNMGEVTPFIFAGVAAFLLNVVISRLVATQREQIGVLKAFGYTNLEIAVHYLGFVIVVAAAGAAVGIAAGAWGGMEYTRMYARFFRFPALTFVLPRTVVVVSALVTGAVAVAAGLGAAMRAAGIMPAEAMRPPAPPGFRRGVLDRLRIQPLVPLAARMVVRNLERRPLRALLSVVAIALAVAIVIVGTFSLDAVHYLTDVQFNAAQRHDVMVLFKEVRDRRALRELEHLPGVLRAEPVRLIAARVRHENRSRRIGIVGLAPGARLTRPVDEQLRPIALPSEGIVLNDALAGVLGIGRDDFVDVEVLEGSRRTCRVRVADVVTEYLGLSAYMDLDAANRLMQEGPTLSGGYLEVDSAAAGRLYAELKATPGVASVSVSELARKSFEETLAAVIDAITIMFGFFGAAIAFAVIYNNNRIAFAERARELGSLHVLGFSHAEMAEILLGEMALLTLVGIPLGILIGRGLGALIITLFNTELARIPLVIAPKTNGTAVSITLASAIVSGFALWRQLRRLDIIGVLKAPE